MAASENNNALSMLDDILDKSIDDLADLPEFKAPHEGVYGLRVSVEMKVINEKPAFIAHFVVNDCKELANAAEVPESEISKAGDKFDIAFIVKDKDGNKNEIAEGFFKKFMAPFHAHYNEKSIKVLITGPLAEGVDITAKVSRKKRRGEEEKYDPVVDHIVVD